MEKTPTDVGVIVARFQVNCLHEAHQELIKKVCEMHQKVIVFLGLSPCKTTYNNPLDFEARKQMVLEQFPKISVLFIKDEPDDKRWSKHLDSQIESLAGPHQTITLYGGRDSFIRHYAGKYDTKEIEQNRFVSGSAIRKDISKATKASQDFRAGVIWAVNNQYFSVHPTVDVAIIDESNERILLAKKEGEKKYRFIGGFASVNGSYEDDAKREAYEETGLEVGSPEYIGSCLINDWRYRSEQNKIKTMFFKCNYCWGLPKASDDIIEVRWFKYKEILNDIVVDEHKPLLKMLLKEIK